MNNSTKVKVARRLHLNIALFIIITTIATFGLFSLYKICLYCQKPCDKYKAITENIPAIFLTPTQICSDNRIEPKETRTENFVFEIPKWLYDYFIETTLDYEYNRPIHTEENINIEMDKNIIGSHSFR